MKRFGHVALVLSLGLILMAPATSSQWTLQVEQIAPGVYVHHGAHEETTAQNRGAIANVGFVVGERCVAVIDPGGTPAMGQALRDAIKRVTDVSVCYVINTHVHPDHIFGNSAFQADEPEFIGHRRLPAQLAARGPYYVEGLARQLGREIGREAIVAPTRTVEDELTLDLGGRRLSLEAMPVAHTDNDLLIRDGATDTLWLSDLLFVERTPALDGSLKGWLAVLDDLQQRPAARAVPGHGPVSVPWPEASRAQRRYLSTLLEQTRTLIAQGATIEEATSSVAASQRNEWLLFDAYNERNVQQAFAELEWE